MHTRWFRFLGMNIKGTPSMRQSKVEHDLDIAKAKADVLVVQEFRWPWYFSAAKKVMSSAEIAWGTSPGVNHGYVRPVAGAQGVMWLRERFKRLRTRHALAHAGVAGVSESRFLRACLLRDRETGIKGWFGTTHFVVGGDEFTDSNRRKAIMAGDLIALDKFLTGLKRGGHPILFQLDANIHKGSWAYAEFMRILRKHGATVHGEHGVEYLFTINGRKAQVEVRNDWIIPTSRLETDHEGRGITARFVRN